MIGRADGAGIWTEVEVEPAQSDLFQALSTARAAAVVRALV